MLSDSETHRIFLVERPAAAIQPHNCGWLRPCTLGYFLCSCKESNQRKHAPGWRAYPRLRGFGSRRWPNETSCLVGQSRTSLCATPSGRMHKVLRGSGAPYGIIKTQLYYYRGGGIERQVFSGPVAAAEHRSRNWGRRETFDRARGAFFAPGELGERRFRREAQGDVGGSGASFFLVTFSWTSKKKSPAVGQPPTSYTSPQATQQKRGARAEPPAISFSTRA